MPSLRPISPPHALLGCGALLLSLFPASLRAQGETTWYLDWRNALIPYSLHATDGAPEQDADADGVSNGVEFLRGTDPMVPDVAPPFSLEWDEGPVLTALAPLVDRLGLAYRLLASPDLLAWSPADDASSTTAEGWQVSLVLGGASRRFFALGIEVSQLSDPRGPRNRLEAENGSLFQAAIEDEWPGFSGTGYVNTANSPGNWVEWTLNLLAAGDYEAVAVAANGAADTRAHSVRVNGLEVATFEVPGGGGWSQWQAYELTLPLLAGDNTIRIVGTSPNGAANLDRLDVFAASGPSYVTFEASAIGPGTLSVSPPPGANGLYERSTRVELQATPDAGSTFAGWTGAASGSEPSFSLLLRENTQVAAQFAEDLEAYVPDFSMRGWATENGGTTGGEGGPVVTVTNYDDLVTHLSAAGPRILHIQGTITGTGVSIRVQSDKSILGLGSDARLENLGLQIGWNSSFGEIGNVIIRNLTFGEVAAPTDKVTVAYGGHNVWIDHCVFESPPTSNKDQYDGQIDITHAGDFVTISWCRFIEHSKNILIGHSENNGDRDTGHLRVTLHHNEFRRTNSRNPSVRFGTVHVFNNYFHDVTDYGIASRQNAQVVVENNFFRNVAEPMNADTNLSRVAGFIRGEATNLYVNSGPNSIITEPATWIPPYAYTLDSPMSVPAIVERYAGVGVITP
jgi:pectate lyase